VPEKTGAVDVQLALGFAPKGRVWWDDIQLTEEPALPKRLVRALTVYHRPRGTKSAAESVEQFCRLVEDAAAQKPDLVCLPEGITVVGNGKKYAEVSEAIPGPTTARLGELAKKLNAVVVAGIYEREGKIVYNTAVLMGRDGWLIGSYRKTHLPREEWEAGITPGNDYPVFQTDFGKVGLIICWDLQFPEPARAMAARGAEILLLPIWGGSETLAKARAIENSVYLVSATYDMRSFIIDPTGQVLAEATKDQPVAVAELNLDAKFYQPWLGDMKTRTWKEWRPDLR
jgi:predicted amidohydrolase